MFRYFWTIFVSFEFQILIMIIMSLVQTRQYVTVYVRNLWMWIIGVLTA